MQYKGSNLVEHFDLLKLLLLGHIAAWSVPFVK